MLYEVGRATVVCRCVVFANIELVFGAGWLL
jgi:hypothetical protein